jgi:ribosome-associated protein
MIPVTDTISIDDSELELEFVRSSGPGGQNVNKLSTAARLRFNVLQSPSLPDAVKQRLRSLAGKRLGADGVLTIQAQRHRTQERNREDALERLLELIRRASEPPTPRRPTRPTAASKQRRLEAKRERGQRKQQRRSPRPDEE